MADHPIYTSASGRIFKDGRPLDLFGLNWFGLDTPDLCLHGLWTGRTLADYLRQIVDMGFTALRLPLCPQAIRPGHIVADWAAERGIGPDGRAAFEAVLQVAGDAGLYVLPDIHTHDPQRFPGGLAPTPYEEGGAYGKQDWLEDLATLARLAFDYPHIIGVDLFNEPHGLSWPQWADLAGQGARAVHAINPGLLIFVEGVGHASADGQEDAFWGSWLAEAPGCMPDIPADKLVWSPHIYGPDVFDQPYFQGTDFPVNMPDIWDRHFGFLYGGDQAVALGEFGGIAAPGTRDAIWQDSFVEYLASKGPAAASQWFFWCLNPNSHDTGGILCDDWKSVERHKLTRLRQLMDISRQIA